MYKGKGSKAKCGDYRGISLLEAVGKVFARLLLNRLTDLACPEVIPEAQCGFLSGRGTVDMVFTARQLQGKCIEQSMSLYQVFVDFTKALNTVNRDAFWKILGKLGCPPSFVDKFRQLHRNMKAQVNFNGQLSEQIPFDNGVKQGDILAPKLFSVYLSIILWLALRDCNLVVMNCLRTTGKVFDLRRFSAKSKTSDCLARELLYADDADLVAHSVEDMHRAAERGDRGDKLPRAPNSKGPPKLEGFSMGWF